MRRAERIFIRKQPDEFPVLRQVVQREVDEPNDSVLRRQRLQIKITLPQADFGIGAFQRGAVEVVLATEIIIDQLLVQARTLRDAVNARAVEALFGEFRPGGGKDGVARRLTVLRGGAGRQPSSNAPTGGGGAVQQGAEVGHRRLRAANRIRAVSERLLP